jgi:two-component system, NarL family, response regulator NreC
MIRVVVAEDHHIVRQGICKLLEAMGEIQVIGEADNGADGVRLTQLLQPDVVLLDISMPKMSGLEALREMKLLDLHPRVVILSMHADVALVQQALEDGALGYVLKQSVSEELLDAVRAASRGSIYMSSEVASGLRQHLFAKHPQNPLERLSPREKQVAEWIVQGKSMKEIAAGLETSIKTIEKQRLDAMRKLGVDNVASLVRVCLELGLNGKSTPSAGAPPYSFLDPQDHEV